ncbi:hypothetical protein PAXINDRAFT_84771 [Paxillus involutus ATCC 200175]|uniref:Myb/SANT-like DNA-binding domain-containing protein n=1 Tax=Paxillus involutus ATCC 200175 TaxID=664439 RepID=A0A0C9TV98_PAXIN|nr:hypothetical protein PAXINDRAFT_84771 [Paxillus involutus ATCC 200175]
MSKRKAPSAAIPDVQWSDDMIWQLIDQMERNENQVVLLEKQQKSDKPSGDSKVAVYQCIGAAVLPTYHTINTVATGDQVKRKYEHLLKKYKSQASQLRTTGKGVKSSNRAEDDESQADKYFDCYIPALGPNIDEIVEAFPFFPTLHRIFSTCPNVTPIAIMTGVGPHRKKTAHFQAPSDDKSNLPAFTPEQHSQMLSLHQVLEAK